MPEGLKHPTGAKPVVAAEVNGQCRDPRAFFDADVRWLRHHGFRPLDMPTLFGGLSL